MKGILVGIAVLAIAVAVGAFVLDVGEIRTGDATGTLDLGLDTSGDNIPGVQSHIGDITIGFDHIDKYAGTSLTDDTDVDVDVYTKRDDGTYKLKKHSTSGSAIVGLNADTTTLYIRPSVPDNDFYFSPDDAIVDNPQVMSWFFEDITDDGNEDFVLKVDVTDVDQFGVDDNGNPKFTIDLTWLDYTIPTSFLNIGGDRDYGVGTGSQLTNKDIALLLTEGDWVGLKSIEFNFNSTVAAAEWDEDKWCMIVPGHPTAGNKLCLDDAGVDRDKFTTTTVYTYDYGTGEFDDLNYIGIKTGGDTSPEFELTAHSDFNSADDGYAVTITLTYREADGDTLTTNTIEVYTVVG